MTDTNKLENEHKGLYNIQLNNINIKDKGEKIMTVLLSVQLILITAMIMFNVVFEDGEEEE